MHVTLQAYLGTGLNSTPSAERKCGLQKLGTNFHLYVLFWAETSQKACKQSPFFSACIWMLGSQGATLVQVLTPAEEMKWKLITLPFETAFLQLMRFQVSPGVPSLFHPKKKKRCSGRGGRFSTFLHAFQTSWSQVKAMEIQKVQIHPSYRHKPAANMHAASHPSYYTFRRASSHAAQTSGQPTGNGSNTLPEVQASCTGVIPWMHTRFCPRNPELKCSNL